MVRAVPYARALPLLGDTIPALMHPLRYFGTRQRRYGNLFKTRIFGKPSVVIYGAQAQQQILVMGGNTGSFPSKEGYTFVEPFMGNSLVQMDGIEHQTQRRLITPAFQSHNYGDYLRRINRAFDRTIACWPEEGNKIFYQEARVLAFRVSTSLMLGIEDGPELADIDHLVHTLFAGSLALMRFNLPFTTYSRALAVKPLLEERLRQIIQQHREGAVNDVLTLFLQARDEQGQPLSDEHLCSHLKLLLFAGYDTTTAALAWSVLELLSHPDLYKQVCAEASVGRVGGEVPVLVEELRAMPLLDACIKETLRLHPPSPFLLRGNKNLYEFEGFSIPAGWQVIIPISYNHRSSEYFTDPEQFDPERFLPPREEDKKTPYAWMAFGGGKHMCLGMGIAQIEIKTVLIRLLRQFQLQLIPDQNISTAYLPIAHPRDGTVLSFQRRAALVQQSAAGLRENG